MKKYLLFYFLLPCLFTGQQLFAAHRTVTQEAGSAEGSFYYELRALGEGDTLLFADALKNKTIPMVKVELNDTQAKNITIIGNGVTFSISTTSSILINRSNGITLENLAFVREGSLSSVTFTVQRAKGPVHLKNCRFYNAVTFYCYPENVVDFKAEGCYFGGRCQIEGDDYDNVNTIHAHLVSCTFKTIVSTSYTDTKATLSLTNCIVDSVAEKKALFTQIGTVTSKGYNVIRAAVGNNATWQTTDKVDASMTSPLASYFDGTYRALENGAAWQNLPANPNTLPGLENVDFPEKDALGETIDYSVATHSGGIQALWSDVPPPPVIPKYTLRLTTRGSVQMQVGESEQMGMNLINYQDNLTKNAPITLYNSHPNIVEAKIVKIGAGGVTPAEDADPSTYNSFLSLKPLKAGKATVRISADGYYPTDSEGNEHPEAADNLTVTVLAPAYPAEYTEGVFFVNEDWFTHSNSSVNFLSDAYGWHYRVYSAVNNNEAFGATTQYGAIYGDHFFFVSKQDADAADIERAPGGRLVVTNARTMQKVAGFNDIGGGDGRAFLGVDDSTGYISTSSNIVRFDIKNMTVGEAIAGTASDGGLYSGQSGQMLRMGDRVFATQQGTGILVIDALTHTIDTMLTGRNYFSLTLDNEGNIWSCISEKATGDLNDDGTSNTIVKIDPYTLETTEITLPAGIYGPASTWAAWQLAPIHTSKQDGKLYWVTGAGSWTGKQIIAYDTKANTAETVFDLTTYDGNQWHAYGGGFGVHPVTNHLYLSIQKGEIYSNVWNTLRINPTSKTIAEEYPMDDYWWYVSMPVFPDKAAPVVDAAAFPTTVTLNATYRNDTLALRPLATDADNIDAAIVKSIAAIGDPTLVGAFIRHDSLFITPSKDVTAEQTTTVTLKFNSNGKVIEKTLNVTVQPGAIENSVTGVALNRTTASLEVGKTLQLAATVAPTNADNRTVIWTSSQPLIASVNASGLVTAILAPGTVTITATTQEGGFTATCTLTTQAVSTPGIVENPFELNLQTLALAPAQTAQLALTAPQHFNTTWSSTVTSVATVTQAGLVTALAAGTTRIIARDIAQGKADTCIVTVTALPATYTLTLNTTTLSLMQGGRSTLQVVVTPQQTGGTLQWSSSNPSIADVSSSGTVIAVSPGTTLITVRLGTVSAVCAVTVTAPVSQLATSGITRTEASVAFPKASNASYYLAHVYELYSGGVKPFLTLKVTPDGEVTLRAAAGNNLVIPLSYLKPSTSYLVHLETIREKGGKSEVIKTEAVAFTTSGNATGLLSPEAVAPRVSYADGALHIEHLEGSDCILTSLHGQTVQRFHVAEVSERRFVDLPAGMYILTAVNAQQRKVFKIVVR